MLFELIEGMIATVQKKCLLMMVHHQHRHFFCNMPISDGTQNRNSLKAELVSALLFGLIARFCWRHLHDLTSTKSSRRKPPTGWVIKESTWPPQARPGTTLARVAVLWVQYVRTVRPSQVQSLPTRSGRLLLYSHAFRTIFESFQVK